jgi:hypothetical protein
MIRTVQSPSFKCHVSSRLKLSFRTTVSTAETYPFSYSRILLVTFIRQLQICTSCIILKYVAIISSAYTPVHTDVKRLPNRCKKTSYAVTKCIPIAFVQRKDRIQKHLREILSHLKHSVCSPQKHTMWSHTISSKTMYPNTSIEI